MKIKKRTKKKTEKDKTKEKEKEKEKPKEKEEKKESKETSKKKKKMWLPLESNPELLDRYVSLLGVEPFHKFHELWAFEGDALDFIPTPVLALCVLYPLSESTEKFAAEENKLIKEKGQQVSKRLYFMNQTVGNACGTVAVCHAVLNNMDFLSLEPKGFFAKFFAQTKEMNAKERAQALEDNTELESKHKETATAEEAKSDVSNPVNDNLHFMTLVCVDNYLYELDGRKAFPINHGSSSRSTFLKDACTFIQKKLMPRFGKNQDIRLFAAALAPNLM
eukprot:TRINITY_DN396_c2_g1_i1.p1 TRINITY_DN396_c2_g1~~TRINITY_DN396_c2_g1_i1.p1  ORF type:complete len:277 (+),score=91.87 TRINITY_DN396_c2_g1_i1:484-1314(+)